MLSEFLVFAGDYRHFQRIRQFLPGTPAALQVDRLAIEPGLHLALDHQHGSGRRHPAQHQHQRGAAGDEPEQILEQAAGQVAHEAMPESWNGPL
ncbi:hypothetical protein D3C81_1056630 [compost metagenome]